MKNLFKQRDLIKKILIIAAPAVLEMGLNTMLMVIDTMMVSRMIGEDAISAVGVVNSIFFLLIFVFSSFNTGAIAMISRSYGEKNMDRVKIVAGNNLVINLMIGLVITIIAFSLRNILFLPYDITEAVRINVNIYFNVIIIGMIFQFGSFAFASISRGVEDTKTPMYITGLANIINIIFNYLLIKGVWLFPELGIQGAAIATTLARAVAFCAYMIIFLSGRHKIRLKIHLLKLQKSISKQLWKISYPGALEQLLMQGAFLLVGIIITSLDTTSEALFRILVNIESTSYMPAVGVSIAAATLVGKALGEKDIKKALNTGYIATIMGVIWGVFAGLMFLVFPTQIISAFSTKEPLINAAIYVMFFMTLNQPLLNFSIVMSGALRGAGDTAAVMKITSLRLWTVFLPLSFLFIRYTNAGVAGVWYAETISFIIFSIIMFKRFQSKKWASLELN